MRRLWTAMAAVVLTMTACGGSTDEDGAGAAEPTSSATSASSSPTERELPDVKVALQDAVRSTARAELLGFTYRAVLYQRAIVTTQGVQRTSGDWSATSRFDEPGSDSGPLRMEVRAADGRVWMTMKDWPAHLADCWLAMTSTQVPVGMLALVPDEVGYVSLLADLDAKDWEAGSTDYVDATISMAGALALFTGQVAQKVTLTPAQSEDIRVDALVKLRNGRVVRIDVDGQALVDEIDRVGGALSEQARSVFNVFRWTVSYDEADTPPEAAPPASLVVTEDELDQGCH